MKKLLLFAFLLALFSQTMKAQEKTAINSTSFVIAPNWLVQFRDQILASTNYVTSTGYTVGVDFARRIAGRWQFKLGLRYNVWNSISKGNFLTWPSEYATGMYVYDPSLPHYTEIKLTDKAWQLLAGARWLGKPKPFRPYLDFEIGATDLAGAKDRLYPTLGAAGGLEWKPGKHFGIFAQPGVRFIFGTGELGNKSLPLQLEMGGRWWF